MSNLEISSKSVVPETVDPVYPCLGHKNPTASGFVGLTLSKFLPKYLKRTRRAEKSHPLHHLGGF